MLVEHDATQCCKAPMDGFRQTAGTLTFGLAERVLEYLPDLLFYQISIKRTHSGDRYRALPFEPAGPCKGTDIYRFLLSGSGITGLPSALFAECPEADFGKVCSA